MNSKNSLKRMLIAMKAGRSIIAVLSLLVSLPGCYTLIAIGDDDSAYNDDQPEPVICPLPSAQVWTLPPAMPLVAPVYVKPSSSDGGTSTSPRRESGIQRGISSSSTSRQENNTRTTSTGRATTAEQNHSASNHTQTANTSSTPMRSNSSEQSSGSNRNSGSRRGQ